jgi:hypothetical protein
MKTDKLIFSLALIIFCTLSLNPLPVSSQSNTPPCSTDVYKQFDFWMGEWEVYDADGKKAGTNVIEKILDGCVIYENWTSAKSNYKGKSFNTYDNLEKTWNQVWVDSTGSTIHFSGSRSKNIMAMTGESKNETSTIYYKMSYTLNLDDTVRQLWEQSEDQDTWVTIFDGLYKKSN